MTELYVKFDSEIIHSKYSNKKYGDWSEKHRHSLESIHASKPDWGSESVSIDFDVLPGTIVYVVWACWSTGNSFGRSHSGSKEVIDIFTSPEKAMMVKRGLENHKECKDEKISWEEKWKRSRFKYENESGKPLEYTCPWFGYFESLEYIKLETMIVEP